MSEDDKEIDIESDDESQRTLLDDGLFVDKRAHHNALERKRRDHIKESFSSLRDAIPIMTDNEDKMEAKDGNNAKLSRAQILKKASEYIVLMRSKNSHHQRDVEELKRQNCHLQEQIRALESAKAAGICSSSSEILRASGLNYDVAADNRASENSGSDASNDGMPVSPSSAPPSQATRSVQPGQSLLITTVQQQQHQKQDHQPAHKRMRV